MIDNVVNDVNVIDPILNGDFKIHILTAQGSRLGHHGL